MEKYDVLRLQSGFAFTKWTLIAILAMMFAIAGCGGSHNNASSTHTPPPSSLSEAIKHVVIIVQENRSTDNLFHGLPNADVANVGRNSLGQAVPLTPEPLANDYDLGHSKTSFNEMYHHGKMDGADLNVIVCNRNATDCPPANAQFKYVNPADVAPYFQLAEQYTFADRMFQTNQGPSFPAHQFLISGTSAPTATSDLFASENPAPPEIGPGEVPLTGCDAPSDQTVLLIDPQGQESSKQYPCFEHQTLVDLLDARMITWKYYTALTGSIWTGPNAIHHLRFGPDWTQHVIANQKQIFSDIVLGQLPQVSWVIPDGRDSDHAGINDGSGPSWVASIVNAIGSSPYWNDTAIFIVWDDWGGWYDHVAPSIFNSYEYGFRVPLIVVSPWAKRGYVSHVTHDFGSLLKFAEEVFNLPSLGYADSRADDLSDCFDLTQPPKPFQNISAPLDVNHFLQDTRAPIPPDDD